MAPNSLPPGEAPEADTPTGTDRARAKARFLDVFGETGNATAAARAAGVGRRTAYTWRGEDAEFRAAWEDAEEIATDAIEAEARRRGLIGYDEPVFYEGEQCGTVKRYSDRMTEILLKGHRPKFRENQRVELSGPNGGEIPLPKANRPTAEEIAAALAILSVGVARNGTTIANEVEIPPSTGNGNGHS